MGQSPMSRPQARYTLGVSFGTFLCARGVKEKYGNGFLTQHPNKKKITLRAL